MSDDGKIIDLAGLTPLEYEKRRREAAKKLGVRTTALDQMVRTERTKAEGKTGLDLPVPAPWPAVELKAFGPLKIGRELAGFGGVRLLTGATNPPHQSLGHDPLQ